MDSGDAADVVSRHKSGVSHHQESVDNKIIPILQYAGGKWFLFYNIRQLYVYIFYN